MNIQSNFMTPVPKFFPNHHMMQVGEVVGVTFAAAIEDHYGEAASKAKLSMAKAICSAETDAAYIFSDGSEIAK